MAGLEGGARISVASINDEIRKLTKPGDRRRRLLGLFHSWGVITYGKSAETVKWRMKYKERTPVKRHPGDPISSAQVNRFRAAELKWHHWVHSEAIEEFERLANRGKSALFNIVEETVKGLADDFNKFLCEQLFRDGDESGEDYMDGLETMYSDISAVASEAYVGTPAGSYAGLSMVLNNYGSGSWSPGTNKAWPEGTGSLEYFFNSPIAVDYTNNAAHTNADTGWGQASATWKDTWRQSMAYAETFLDSLHGVVPDVWIMTPSMLNDCRMSLIDKERIMVGQNPELTKLGFRNISHDGVDLISDHFCTAEVCYGLVKSKIEFRNMLDQVVTKEDDDDITTLTKVLVLRTYCNLKFESPAFFPCLRAIGGS